MPTEPATIKNLDEVYSMTLQEGPIRELCHIYAIYKREDRSRLGPTWILFDEYREMSIILCGRMEEYPRPKPGDVVRIHRLRINPRLKRPEIVAGKNVVYWPSFQYNPSPISTAKNPTITEDDNNRRRILESLFCSRITSCLDILRSNQHNNIWFQAVAGCVEDNQLDLYGHRELKFVDGTEGSFADSSNHTRPVLRVFKVIQRDEVDTHFEVAKDLQVGQYFVATNVKLHANMRVNLSASLLNGRSLRKVDEASILGVKLRESTADTGSSQQTNTSNSQVQPRRSPRLNQLNNNENQISHPTSQSISSTSQTMISTKSNVENTAETTHQSHRELKFKRFIDIQPKEVGYDFYDLVGQVRDQPRLTNQYGNCTIQIYDGSRHKHASYYLNEVERVLEGCLVMYIYSKQKDSDTNEHFEKAMKLRPGDLIHIKNAKVSFKESKLKLELQANKSHDKSINVINPNTIFGQKVLNMVQTPQVEEVLTFETVVTNH